MPLLVVGISHKTAPLSVLERFALSPEQGERMLEQLVDYTQQGVVLATCNRTEIYTTAHQPNIGAQHLQRFLAHWTDAPLDEVGPYLYTYTQWRAVDHLFRVASGLDSMVVGEEQILGQVRTAMEQAKTKGTADPVLAKAFQSAIRAGRRVRSETAISRNAASVSSVAVSLAKSHFGDLGKVRVLIISAGEAGKLATRSLIAQGVRHLEVTSRSYERAVTLAERMGGVAIPFEQLDSALAQADLVITATSAPEHLLTYLLLKQTLERRGERPLVIVDIAVPRDVDPAVAVLPGVRLYNIEDIQSYVEHNLHLRAQEADKAQAIVEEEVKHFQGWWHSQSVLPTITALRHKVEAIREDELRKTWRKLPHLSEEERARIEAMSKAIAKKLLHDPFVYLKARRDGENSIETVQALFGLDLVAEGHPSEGTSAPQKTPIREDANGPPAPDHRHPE